MSEMGHSRRFCHIRYTSGYRLISDIDRAHRSAATSSHIGVRCSGPRFGSRLCKASRM
jgi:hypothetical protein